MAWWVPLAAAAIGAASTEYQGRKQREAMKKMQKEQDKRDRANLLAQAHGLSGMSRAMSPGPQGTAIPGAFGGAQMALLNKDLWSDMGKDDSKNEEQAKALAAMQLYGGPTMQAAGAIGGGQPIAGQQPIIVLQDPYASPYDTYNPMAFMGGTP